MILQDLLDLGVNPRIAVALNRMISAGKLPVVSKTQLRTASEMASKSLCASIADTFHKVAKGGGGGGGGGSSTSAPPKPSGGGGGGGGGGYKGVMPSGPAYACFVEGSLVKTATGSTPIEALVAGNKVIGFDEITGETKTLTVEKTASKPVDSYLQFHTESTSFNVTESHPLLTRTGWVNAGSIKEGDALLGFSSAGKQVSEVLSVTAVEKSANVYIMEIAEDPHTYIIDGIVAHNAKIADDDEDDGPPGIMKAEDMSEEASKEASIRKDERKVAEWTVKLAYALAKHLGANEETALTASMYAFTQIPFAHEVQSEVLEAEWWLDGRRQ